MMQYPDIEKNGETYKFRLDMVNAKGDHLIIFQNQVRKEMNLIKINQDGKLVDFDMMKQIQTKKDN